MQVRIGYRDYTIREWDQVDGMANRCFGKCDTNTATIFVDQSLTPDKRANTAIHEVLHAIWYEMCVEDEDDEERTVQTAANGLTQVIKDNPDFIAWLQSNLRKS